MLVDTQMLIDSLLGKCGNCLLALLCTYLDLDRITVSFAKFYNTELLLAKSLKVKKFAEMKETPRHQSILNQDLLTDPTFEF